MAKTKFNAKAPLVAASDLHKAAKRVESQRQRLFGVIGIVGCASEAVGDELAKGKPDIKAALDLALEILDGVAGELDPTHFRLSQVAEVAHV